MRSLHDLLRVDGRVALITGGAGRLGGAFGETLGELGATLVLLDRDREACRARAAELSSRFGVPTHALSIDLADKGATAEVVRRCEELAGGLDILINNAAYHGQAGIGGYAVPFGEQTLEAWEQAVRVNLDAPFQLCHAARELLGRSGHGAIINISSIYGVVGPNFSLYENTSMGNPAAYAASKGALVQLTRYLSTALAPRVRVNAISPGGIAAGQPAAFTERYHRLTPLGRMGDSEDLKGAIALLATDAGAYITGQNLMVDGGWTAW